MVWVREWYDVGMRLQTISSACIVLLLGAGIWYYLQMPHGSVRVIDGKTYYVWSVSDITRKDVAAFRSALPQDSAYGDDCSRYAAGRTSVVDFFFDSERRLCLGLTDTTANGVEVQKIINLRGDTVIVECRSAPSKSVGQERLVQHTCTYQGSVWAEYLTSPTDPPFFYPLGPSGVREGTSMWSKLKASY